MTANFLQNALKQRFWGSEILFLFLGKHAPEPPSSLRDERHQFYNINDWREKGHQGK